MSIFTDKIDYLLIRNEIRRADLSRGTGIPESSIRNWYNDKNPNVEMALKISKYFGVTVEWLFSDAGIEEINKIKDLKIQPELNLDQIQPLNFQEQKLIDSFRELDNRDKNSIIKIIGALKSKD